MSHSIRVKVITAAAAVACLSVLAGCWGDERRARGPDRREEHREERREERHDR